MERFAEFKINRQKRVWLSKEIGFDCRNRLCMLGKSTNVSLIDPSQLRPPFVFCRFQSSWLGLQLWQEQRFLQQFQLGLLSSFCRWMPLLTRCSILFQHWIVASISTIILYRIYSINSPGYSKFRRRSNPVIVWIGTLFECGPYTGYYWIRSQEHGFKIGIH
jgi:hypothetical protein